MRINFYKYFITVLFFLAVTNTVQSQLQNPLYADGDKVAFVGNSITRNGEFHAIIALYQATRFPSQKVRFYNRGISGDVASGVIKRYKVDVMQQAPNKIAIMLGMNDVGGYNYAENLLVGGVFPSNIIANQQASRDVYIAKMTELIGKFKADNCQVVIQSPTIYDEKVNLPSVPKRLQNGALTNFSLLCKGWATDHNFPFVDYNTELNKIDALEKVVNPSFSFTPTDRVHPEALGHFVMACTFLKAVGMPATVSNIEVAVGSNAAQVSENAIVNNIALSADGGSFKVFEHSLPMPLIAGTEKALSWSYFDYYNELNSQKLKITGLNSTQSYGLVIGGIAVDNFTGAQLAAGVNLAKYTTPQSMQAEKIKALIYKKRDVEWKIRQMRRMENFLSQTEMETMTMQEKMAAVAARSTELEADKAAYALDRPNEEVYKQQIVDIENETFLKQVPTTHTYTIGAPITVVDYNKNDLNQLITFLTQPSIVQNKTNAEVLGITNLQDPSTWPQSGTVNNSSTAWVWNTTSPKTLARLNLNNITDKTALTQLAGSLIIAPASANLAGLNLTGCSNINSFELAGISSGPFTTYFDNCSNISKIDLSAKTSSVTYLYIRNCAKLKELNLNANIFTATDGAGSSLTTNVEISNNPLLSAISKVNIAINSVKTVEADRPNAFIRITDHALMFSQLPTITKFITRLTSADTIAFGTTKPFILNSIYNYSTNQHEVSMDKVIDLSAQSSISLNSTQSNTSMFTWYNASNNAIVVPEIVEPGKFKLSGADFALGASYYVKINNNRFQPFGLSEIKSAPFRIQSLTSVPDVNADSRLQIFPTVATNILHLSINDKITFVEIYNLSGSKISNFKLNSTQIDISSLSAGSYILKCSSSKQVYTTQFFKK